MPKSNSKVDKQNKSEFKTFWIHKDTHKRIGDHGTKNETYDEIMNRILDGFEDHENVCQKGNKGSRTWNYFSVDGRSKQICL